MLRLDRADLAGALCHLLEARLRRMPWAEMLRQRSHEELQALALKLGVDPVGAPRRIVSKLVSAASQDDALQERLVDMLVVPLRMQRLVDDTAVGYRSECPQFDGPIDSSKLRSALRGNSSGTGLAPSQSFQEVFLALGDAALQRMATKYMPEVQDYAGERGATARRLTSLLLSIVSPEEARDILELDSADLVGALCHWLEVRLRQMPLIGTLRRMPHQKFHMLLLRVGLVPPMPRTKPSMMATLLSSASQDDMVRDRLARELTALTHAACGFNGTVVGYLGECPDGVRLAVEA